MEQALLNPMVKKVWNAIWQQRILLAFIAVVSLVILSIICLILMLLTPKEKLYSQDIRLFLEKNKKGLLVYPNEKPFNRFDIISAPVLKQIYTSNKLEKLISYEDFASSFSVVNYSPRQAFVDAEYAQKLNRRNLTAIELKELEKEYHDALAALDQESFRVSMIQNNGLSDAMAVKVVSEIPQVWMDIFRRQEAKGFPKNILTSDLKEKWESEFQGSPLIAIDRTLYYNGQMERLCRELTFLQQDRRIALPGGEFLEDVSERLLYIRNYQLNVLLQMIVDDHTLLGPLDLIFVASRIRSFEQALEEKRGMLKNVENSIAQLRDNSKGQTFGGPAGDGNSGGSQLNFDASFFAQLSELIRNDVMSATRVQQVEAFSQLGNEVAVIEAQLAYYTKLLSGMQNAGGSQKVDAQRFNKLFQNMLTEMIQAGRKLDDFKAIITKDALSNREFYVPEGPMLIRTEYGFSKKYMMLGVFAIWLLINVCSVATVAGKVFWLDEK